jgi:competence protein ComEC
LIYDAGAIGSPHVARRQIAPFLWSRGIRRIDEVFLSHADSDHFNGLPQLVERYPIGRVIMTPTFAAKSTPLVRQTLALLADRNIPTQIVSRGDVLDAGSVRLEVLHPPASGPEGVENVRSLVLLVHHEDHRILLTGDLSGPGLQQVLAQPATSVDVLMSPHHGSFSANPPTLTGWCRPTWVVANDGPADAWDRTAVVHARFGAEPLSTWDRGAITVRSRPGSLDVSCFRATSEPAPRRTRR